MLPSQVDRSLGYGPHLTGDGQRLPADLEARALQGDDPGAICDEDPSMPCCDIIADAYNDCDGVLPDDDDEGGDDGPGDISGGSAQPQPQRSLQGSGGNDGPDYDQICSSTCADKLADAQTTITPEQAGQGVCPMVLMFAVRMDA